MCPCNHLRPFCLFFISSSLILLAAQVPFCVFHGEGQVLCIGQSASPFRFHLCLSFSVSNTEKRCVSSRDIPTSTHHIFAEGGCSIDAPTAREMTHAARLAFTTMGKSSIDMILHPPRIGKIFVQRLRGRRQIELTQHNRSGGQSIRNSSANFTCLLPESHCRQQARSPLHME